MLSADDIRLRNLIEQRGLLSRGDLEFCSQLVDQGGVSDILQAIRTQDLLPEPTLRNLLSEAGIAADFVAEPSWRRSSHADHAGSGRRHTEALGGASRDNGSGNGAATNGQANAVGTPEMSASDLDSLSGESPEGQTDYWDADSVEWAGADTSDGDPFGGLSAFPAEEFNGDAFFSPHEERDNNQSNDASQGVSAPGQQDGSEEGEHSSAAGYVPPESSGTAPVPLDEMDSSGPDSAQQALHDDSSSGAAAAPVEEEDDSRFYQAVSDEEEDDFQVGVDSSPEVSRPGSELNRLDSAPDAEQQPPQGGSASTSGSGEQQAARVNLPGSDVQPNATRTPGTTGRVRKMSWESLRLGASGGEGAPAASGHSGSGRRSAPALPTAPLSEEAPADGHVSGSRGELPAGSAHDSDDLSRAHRASDGSQSGTSASGTSDRQNSDTSWAKSSPEWRTDNESDFDAVSPEGGEAASALPVDVGAAAFSAESSDEVPMVSYEALLAADEQMSAPSELAPLEPTPEESALLQSDVFMFGSGALQGGEAPPSGEEGEASEFFEHILSESQRLEQLGATAADPAPAKDEEVNQESTARTLAQQALAHLHRAQDKPAKPTPSPKPQERNVEGRDAYDLEGCRLGRIKLVEKVGHGATGCVYRGEDQRMHREVAVKVMPRAFASDPSSRERFIQEAITLAKFEPHTNIVAVYDVDEEDGLVYLAMQFVRGCSLADMVRRRGVMSEYQTVAIIRQVLQALDYAHGKGLIHRDIKPDNILITDDGTAKLTDFGLARQLGRDSGMTQAGAVVGTPYYIAPEAIDSSEADARADLFAIGVTLYECLTGNRPFSGPNVQAVLLRIVSETPVPPRERNPKISEALENIILKLLEKDPAQRYPSAASVLTAFAEWSPDDALSAISDRFSNGRTRRVPVETFPTPPGRSGTSRHTASGRVLPSESESEGEGAQPQGEDEAEPASHGQGPTPTPPLGLPAEAASEWGHGTSIDEEMLAQAFTPDMLAGVDETHLGAGASGGDTAEELPALPRKASPAEGEAFPEAEDDADEAWSNSAMDEDPFDEGAEPASASPTTAAETTDPDPPPDAPTTSPAAQTAARSQATSPAPTGTPRDKRVGGAPSRLPLGPTLRSGAYAFESGRSRYLRNDEPSETRHEVRTPREERGHSHRHESSAAGSSSPATGFRSERRHRRGDASTADVGARPTSTRPAEETASADTAAAVRASQRRSPRYSTVSLRSEESSAAMAYGVHAGDSSTTYIATRTGSSSGQSTVPSKPWTAVARRGRDKVRRRRKLWQSTFARYALGLLLVIAFGVGGFLITTYSRPTAASPPSMLPADTLVFVEGPSPEEVLERIKQSQALLTPLEAVEAWEEDLAATLLELGRAGGHHDAPRRLWRYARSDAARTTLALVPEASAATADAQWVWMFSGLEASAFESALAGYAGISEAEPILGADGRRTGYVFAEGETLPVRAAAFVGQGTLVASASPGAVQRVVDFATGNSGYSLHRQSEFRRWWDEQRHGGAYAPPEGVRMYLATQALAERVDSQRVPPALRLAFEHNVERITAVSRSRQGVAGTDFTLGGHGIPLLDVPLKPLEDTRMLEALAPDVSLMMAGRVEPSRRGYARLYRWMRSLGEPVRSDVEWLLKPVLGGSADQVERLWSGEFAWARTTEDRPLLVLGVRSEPSSDEVRDMLASWIPTRDTQGRIRSGDEQSWALSPTRLILLGTHPETVAKARERILREQDNLAQAPAYRRLRPGLDAKPELLGAWRLERMVRDAAGFDLNALEHDTAIAAERLVLFGLERRRHGISLRVTVNDVDLTALALTAAPLHLWGALPEEVAWPGTAGSSPAFELSARVTRANVELRWSLPEFDVPGEPSHLVVQRRLVDGRDRAYEVVTRLSPNARSYVDEALLGNHVYEYRLALRTADGSLTLSHPHRVSVPQHSQPVAPPNLEAPEALWRERSVLGTRYVISIAGNHYTVGDVLRDGNDHPFRIAGVRTQGERLYLTLVSQNGSTFQIPAPQPSGN